MEILNQNCLQMHRLIILCFLFTFTAAAAAADDDYPNHISINCGGAAPATALTRRQWLRDAAPEGSSTSATVKGELITVVDPVPYTTAAAAAAAAADDPNHISINCGGAAPATALSGRQWLRDAAPEGSSTSATVKGELITVVDPVPHKTARISRSQFSYSFQMSPGQKFIRLHFNPVPYHGFESFNDLFTVEAGPFTLLANFSASITARALSVNTIIKEFCVVLQENQPLNIVFTPETSFHSKYNHAFINGIEIISVPSTISYCHGGDSGVRVLGKNYVIHVENTTALEVVHRQDIKWGSLSSDNDGDGMFGLWANKAYNRSWRVSVDVGFRYLVRLHLCEVGLKMDFRLLVNNMIALTSADMPEQRGDQTNLWYNNYMVMVEGHKREGKRLITICLHSPHEFLNRRGPLEGFEVLKLSNPDLSLASPNPLPPRVDSPSQTILTRLQSLLGLKNVATVVFTTLCLVKITTLLLHKMWGPDFSKEENLPSARARRLCRHFTLAEIRSATQNFHVEFLLGKGGFGKVYKGLLDNGRDVVAIKRSKPDSNQGEQQFWTEVEMLSELRHVNLVSLIGYCMEQQEMILVYEYMPRGTLADHLYKLSRKSNPFYPLSWKQRLKICIGAGRALDYLHTGHGIIHRDVKASNILLDEKFVAKVSDFGLAKTGSGSESQSQDSTNFKGTIGYIDPNYFRTRKITKNSDTYSFGVVLLEVLCGRPAVEPWEDKHGLTTWAIDNIRKGQVDHIVAPSLRGEILVDSLKTFVKVAERCLHEEPKKRPAMTHIVIELELAFQQQEKAESLPLKEHMNFMSPNEKINVAENFSPSPSGKILPEPNLRIFTFSELKVATRNFRSDSVLGDGGFGTVYKGLLHENLYSKAGSGTLIAVKKLNSKSKQGFQEWQSEVNFLGRLSHPNLVTLLGYGWEGKTLFLVYEFMPKGSISNHLFGRGASVQPLPWGIRLKILVGAAHGLAFLHDTNVIQRDFKISNILLDGSYQAKLSDLGLAKMGPADIRSHVTAVHVLITSGYAAPEYVATGHLHVKSDVYGFGVVLVVMLTGLYAWDPKRPSGQHNLTDWIKPHLSERRKLEKIIDARLEGRYPCKSAVQIAQLALHCLENDPKNRPSMQEVVETLELVVSADERPQECRVHFSHQVVNQQGEQPLAESFSSSSVARGYSNHMMLGPICNK